MKPDLKWGETPWDDMSRGELLREVQRMFAALQAAQSVISLARAGQTASPFWGPHGTGGRAWAQVTYTLEAYEKDERYREKVYRMFFRYAVDLLFPGLGVGFGWVICDKCKSMLGADPTGKPPESCIRCKDEGPPLRPIAWADLAPLTEG